MKMLYIDAIGGASGDMLAGAMLDLGWPLAELEKLIADMGLKNEVSVGIDHPMHNHVRCSRLDVRLLSMSHHHSHNHHEHQHEHDHQAGHHHHARPAIKNHDHEHRNLEHILALLQNLPEAVATPAARVFQCLAEAEAKVHGVSVTDIYFHEVGALDAIVDVVAFCAALHWLKPARVLCSPLPLGKGFVDCAHGRMPLPAPAVVNLLQDVPVYAFQDHGETVTPTGAALLVTLVDEFADMPSFKLLASGLGGGSRASVTQPNLLRMLVGESESKHVTRDYVTELECNIDDQLAEDFPYICGLLMSAGALDVSSSPLLMKKGRPGLNIKVLCAANKVDELVNILLTQSTSLGVRMQNKQRYLLPREIYSIDTPWGVVRVKKAMVDGVALRHHFEAEDVLRVCRDTGMGPSQVREELYKLIA